MGGMRRALAALAASLVAAGCAASALPPAAGTAPVRLLIAGAVDLTGTAATVARSDPEGVLREVRLAARRADLALVSTALPEAEEILGAGGFDAAVCPEPRALAGSATGLLPPPALVAAACPGPGAPPGQARPALPGRLAVAVVPGAPAENPPWADVVIYTSGGSPEARLTAGPDGRPRLVVYGMGDLLSADASTSGALLEVLGDETGLIAYRLGGVTHTDFRAHFSGWDLPRGDAALLGGEWWALARQLSPAPASALPPLDGFTHGEVTAAAAGDVTGDGSPDLAVSYRHPFRPGTISEALPDAVGVDSQGRSAHLGVFTLEGTALWAAGVIPRPVTALAACDGSVALAYDGLDDPAVVATGAAVWTGWALSPAPELPGPGTPACADVDGDGHLDPVVLGRQV